MAALDGLDGATVSACMQDSERDRSKPRGGVFCGGLWLPGQGPLGGLGDLSRPAISQSTLSAARQSSSAPCSAPGSLCQRKEVGTPPFRGISHSPIQAAHCSMAHSYSRASRPSGSRRYRSTVSDQTLPSYEAL